MNPAEIEESILTTSDFNTAAKGARAHIDELLKGGDVVQVERLMIALADYTTEATEKLRQLYGADFSSFTSATVSISARVQANQPRVAAVLPLGHVYENEAVCADCQTKADRGGQVLWARVRRDLRCGRCGDRLGY